MSAPDYTSAQKQASKLLSDGGFDSSPINLANVLNYLDLKLVYDSEIEDEALLDPMEKTIFLKKDAMPIKRKIFSIAHEIGHWILHSRDKKRPRVIAYDSEHVDQTLITEEQEANAFAAELLMPFNEVRKMIMLGYTAENLADHFNVSYEFASYRHSFVSRQIF